MECKDARALIGAGGTGEGPSAHLREHLAACEACREHARLWELLGEAGALERGLDFTERVVAGLAAQENHSENHSERHGERRGPWGWLQAMLAPRPASTRTLDEFADFPPESFGALLFGRREARE